MEDQALTPPVRRTPPRALVAAAAVAAAIAFAGVAVAIASVDAVAELEGNARTWALTHLDEPLRWAVLVSFGYLLLAYLTYAGLLAYAGLERILRARERQSEDFETLRESRFTIPVSIVVAVYNERPVVAGATRSLLAQEYPELEVIVVDDGSTDGTFEELQRAFDLQPETVFARTIIETRTVGSTYRSRLDPRLLVVRKLNGGKADALNCGINFARYRYVLGADGDTIYRPDALLKGMRLVVRDPARVVAVTSHIAISFNPERSLGEDEGRRRVDSSLFSNFQHLDYLRSFLNNRLAWTRLRFMLCVVGAFHLWRRDVLEEVGGFSRNFTCEDIELTFRIHERFRREGRDYEILSLPDTVATTEGPDTIGALVKQRARWQRVIAETVWHYRRMFLNPRYGTVGMIGVPFYLVTEVIAPAFELLAIAALVIAAWTGLIGWLQFALVFGAIAAVNAILSSFAVLMEDRTTRSYRLRDLVRLQLIAPLEVFVYRPILVWARLRGTWDFLHGRRDWDKFERNHRHPDTAS